MAAYKKPSSCYKSKHEGHVALKVMTATDLLPARYLAIPKSIPWGNLPWGAGPALGGLQSGSPWQGPGQTDSTGCDPLSVLRYHRGGQLFTANLVIVIIEASTPTWTLLRACELRPSRRLGAGLRSRGIWNSKTEVITIFSPVTIILDDQRRPLTSINRLARWPDNGAFFA